VSKTPKVITGPVQPDYADLPEDERLAVAGTLAATISEVLR
jgi:hypothetical protein